MTESNMNLFRETVEWQNDVKIDSQVIIQNFSVIKRLYLHAFSFLDEDVASE